MFGVIYIPYIKFIKLKKSTKSYTWILDFDNILLCISNFDYFILFGSTIKSCDFGNSYPIKTNCYVLIIVLVTSIMCIWCISTASIYPPIHPWSSIWGPFRCYSWCLSGCVPGFTVYWLCITVFIAGIKNHKFKYTAVCVISVLYFYLKHQHISLFSCNSNLFFIVQYFDEK